MILRKILIHLRIVKICFCYSIVRTCTFYLPMGEKSIYCHMQVVMRVCALRSTINFGRSTITLQKMSHHPFRAKFIVAKCFRLVFHLSQKVYFLFCFISYSFIYSKCSAINNIKCQIINFNGNQNDSLIHLNVLLIAN